MCHHIQQGLLFQVYLIVIIDMLQATTATNLKGFAARRDTQRRWLDYFERVRLIEIAVSLQNLYQHCLTGQRPEYKHGLAIDVGDAPPFVGHGIDGDLLRLRQLAASPAVSSHLLLPCCSAIVPCAALLWSVGAPPVASRHLCGY